MSIGIIYIHNRTFPLIKIDSLHIIHQTILKNVKAVQCTVLNDRGLYYAFIKIQSKQKNAFNIL